MRFFIQYRCCVIQYIAWCQKWIKIPPKHKVNTALNDNSDSINSSSDERDDMEGNSAPKMDWTSKDLPTAWKAFRQHCEFTFGGPLKRKSEEEKCNYLVILVGDKGRDKYNTWELTADEAITNSRRITQDLKPMWSPDRTRCLPGMNFIWECNKPVSHLNSFLLNWSY